MKRSVKISKENVLAAWWS